MKGTNLGEFEELVLLTVAVMNGQAYGVSIADKIEEQTGRSVTISTVHTALYRLEKKGYVHSNMEGATKIRGGRRKRIYVITAIGHRALVQARSVRDKLWGLMPDYNF